MAVLARSTAVVLALCAACSSGAKIDAGVGGPDPNAAVNSARRRCVVRDRVRVDAGRSARVLTWARSPGGPALFVNLGASVGVVSDGASMRSSDGFFDPRGAAWVDGRYLLVDGESLVSADASLNESRATRRDLRPPAVALAGGASHALLVTGRLARGAASGYALEAAVLGPDGAALGPSRSLGAPVEGLRGVSARWDFGRYVVTAESDRAPARRSWVLGPDAELLWDSRTSTDEDADEMALVACPSRGCVRVRGLVRGGEDPSLYLAPIDAPQRGWFVGVRDGAQRAVAASGERVAVLHEPPGLGGCQVTVVDVARREILADFGESFLRCDPSEVMATPTGFVLGGGYVDPDGDGAGSTAVWTRALDCDD